MRSDQIFKRRSSAPPPGRGRWSDCTVPGPPTSGPVLPYRPETFSVLLSYSETRSLSGSPPVPAPEKAVLSSPQLNICQSQILVSILIQKNCNAKRLAESHLFNCSLENAVLGLLSSLLGSFFILRVLGPTEQNREKSVLICQFKCNLSIESDNISIFLNCSINLFSQLLCC